ncbi:pyrroline-5-carboxylate reductase [Tichowtungia aerotolerans]|uniref:Pyrroline-5-carboxylate reductase n=2 Tax=Tichowtungia aerotolerans TaxID=2697043 RepID=A0A6P1MG17_9BACT|nr:pyrroline-5-carboxylate reductase [Tichowtungia aerotolerans]
MESKVVFVGAGNMAEAIAAGMVRAEFCAAEKIVMTDIRPERLSGLETDLGVSTSADNSVVKNAEIVVLAVKPQIMNDVLEDIAPVLRKETLVISIAAGITAEKIERALGEGTRVIRVMPNTPALIGQGASGIAAGRLADEADLEVAETILGCVGETVRVDEKDLDAVTALSGSGPAYVFYLLESMLAAAEEMGLEKETARTLALQTVEGAARLMKDSGEEAAELRAKVTSKGGTTFAAMTSMEESGVKPAIIKALKAAQMRSKELSG